MNSLGAKLHTKPVGAIGIVVGGGAIVASIASFFKLIEEPQFLVQLYEATKTHHDASMAVAKLAAAFIGIIGAFVIALAASYFGKSVFAPPETPPTQGKP